MFTSVDRHTLVLENIQRKQQVQRNTRLVITETDGRKLPNSEKITPGHRTPLDISQKKQN